MRIAKNVEMLEIVGMGGAIYNGTQKQDTEI
jgi:hypothetical protein